MEHDEELMQFPSDWKGCCWLLWRCWQVCEEKASCFVQFELRPVGGGCCASQEAVSHLSVIRLDVFFRSKAAWPDRRPWPVIRDSGWEQHAVHRARHGNAKHPAQALSAAIPSGLQHD